MVDEGTADRDPGAPTAADTSQPERVDQLGEPLGEDAALPMRPAEEPDAPAAPRKSPAERAIGDSVRTQGQNSQGTQGRA